MGLRVVASWLAAGIGSAVAAGVLFTVLYGRASWTAMTLAALGGILVQRAVQLGEP